jgi:hypothetical protein
MRTITVLLHKRPGLLGAQLEALSQCQDLDKFDLLNLSIDVGSPQTGLLTHLCNDVAVALAPVISTSVRVSNHQLGVGEHPRAALREAFESDGSQLNVSLEDDALPKPDLLRMALWYEEVADNEVALISFCNHRDFGRGRQTVVPEDDPSIVAESAHISSPFAWATIPQHWEWIQQNWNFKKAPPLGWDYSLSMAMRLTKRVGVHPVLSRCQNVGRLDGVHESPESFDRTQLGLRYQEEEYHGKYLRQVKVDRGELEKLDLWMLPEIWAQEDHAKPEGFCMGCYKFKEECGCGKQV